MWDRMFVLEEIREAFTIFKITVTCYGGEVGRSKKIHFWKVWN
jgi:hypothetical protein